MSNVIEFKQAVEARRSTKNTVEATPANTEQEEEMFGTTAESIDSMVDAVGLPKALLMLTRSLRTMTDMGDEKALYQIANVIDYIVDNHFE